MGDIIRNVRAIQVKLAFPCVSRELRNTEKKFGFLILYRFFNDFFERCNQSERVPVRRCVRCCVEKYVCMVLR